MSVNSKMTAIADKIRTLLGISGTMGLDAMANNLGTVQTNISSAFTAIGNKGGTVPSSKVSGNLATAIQSIPTDPVLQSKTVNPSTSNQTVKPDSGYDGLSDVIVNAITTATQATPNISVSTSGLITASAKQTAGYVAAGTKSATKQLTTQAAQTITPGTSDKTIASGRYLTGTQTIKGDRNLVAGNIKQGVSIFGVSGSLEVNVTVQTTSGTFTTDSDGVYYADCGFLPDAVIIYRENGNGNDYMTFLLRDVGLTNYHSATLIYEGTIKGTCEGFEYQGMSGFSGTMWGYNWDWSAGTFIPNLEFKYMAFKFV